MNHSSNRFSAGSGPQENVLWFISRIFRWESTPQGPSPVACWQSPTAAWPDHLNRSQRLRPSWGSPGDGSGSSGEMSRSEVMACPSSSRRPSGGEALLVFVFCCNDEMMIQIDSMNSILHANLES